MTHPTATSARRRLIGLAAGAGVLLGLGLALVWPAGGGATDGARASRRPTSPVASPAPRARAASTRATEEAAVARAAPTPRVPGTPATPTAETRPGPAPPPGPDARPGVARAPGTLDLNAVPWADVWVDGVARGTTPVRGISLPAGRHRVRLANGPLGVDRTVVVTVRPAEHRALVVNLREDGTNVAPGMGGSP